jgi:predicted transcriptional regulator
MTVDNGTVLLQAVQAAIHDAGLTQVTLAAYMGVDQARVSNLLRGKRGATLSAAHGRGLRRDRCARHGGAVAAQIGVT